MSYRNDVDALAARHAALETEVAERARERDRAADLLREARARAKLPVLDNIRIASPCGASWDAMTGDARVRACGDCNKNVYNLSELTRDEAEALIVAHEGKLCVRYYRRADGTILTKDCAVGARRTRRRRWVAAGMIATFATGIGAYFMRRGEEPTCAQHGEHLMGDVAGPPLMGAVAATPPPTKPSR
jgi:hypothetical protein